MTDKERIRQEIKRQRKQLIGHDDSFQNKWACGVLDSILAFIDSLPAASPELEKAAEEYARTSMVIADAEKYKGFIAGAEWQKQQMMKEAVMWKKAKEGFKCGADAFVFTLEADGKMTPYYDVEVEEGQYYLTEQDLENLPREQ